MAEPVLSIQTAPGPPHFAKVGPPIPGDSAPTAFSIGQHELLRPIASGSYGEVWLARSAVGQLRAVKIVRRDRFERAEDFDREFKGLQNFEPVSRQYSGLVDILHIGRHDAEAWFYYVMELADAVGSDQCSVVSIQSSVPGTQPTPLNTEHCLLNTYQARTLRHDLKQYGHFAVEDCIQIGLKLSTALAHLHAHGLVHRDVKPSNILFIGGEPKLADAGLVAAVDDARSLVGTAGYIAPEGPGTPQADLYALGKVLYEAAFGKDRQEFPALPADVASRPDHARLLELNAILLKACAADRRDRYQSADHMRADLELLRAGRSVKRRQAWQEARRLTVRLGAAVAVIMAAWFLFNRFNESTFQPYNATTRAASIFVLPFRNDGTNQVEELLRSRITDAIRDSLALIDGVKVGPRKSGWLHRPETDARREAYQQFSVRAVLSGTVNGSDQKLRLALTLRDMPEDRVHWQETFTGAATNWAELEIAVIQTVAARLEVAVPDAVTGRLATLLADNQRAYELFRSAPLVGTAINLPEMNAQVTILNRAILADSSFVEAYVELAWAYRNLGAGIGKPGPLMEEMRKNAAKALELDDTSVGALSALACVKFFVDHDFTAAENLFRRAAGFSATDADGSYSVFLRGMGRAEEARVQIERVSSLWRARPVLNTIVGQMRFDRRYNEAIALCHDMVKHWPESALHEENLAWIYFDMGEMDQAIAVLKAGLVKEDTSELLGMLGFAYAAKGEHTQARAVLARLQERVRYAYIIPYFVARIHAALREKTEALDWLDKAYEDRNENLVNADYGGLRTDVAWKVLEDEPRFKKLLEKVGLHVWPVPAPSPR